MTRDAYRSFLECKVKLAAARGFAIETHEINPILKDHQAALVRWAVQGGCRAIFAAFGLGKSVVQLEVCRLIAGRAGGMALIVAPLGVRQEFVRDGRMLGLKVKFVRRIEECEAADVYVTNYETVRDGKLNPNAFTVVCLDEASVLRSFGSKTYQEFLTLFDHVRFRFVATATPSPNRYKELIHYAGFLGIMDTGQALTRFFQRNPSKAGDLTLYPHKEKEFFLWLNSWAVFLQRPSDIGFSDQGYELPPLQVIHHEVASAADRGRVDTNGQALLIPDAAMGLADAAREKRSSLTRRVAKLIEILNADPGGHCLIWHDLEAEREAIQEALPEVVAVYGAQDDDAKEKAIIDFSEGRIQYLAGKPVMLGSGCNFQRHCHRAVFLGIGFKFNDFIQAVHRIQRFQQAHPVEIHIIHAEGEREVLRELMAKWQRDLELRDTMTAIIRENGLDPFSMGQALTRSLGVERVEASGPGWLVTNNDCVAETRGMADNAVDLIVTSIPFSNHYEYSPSYNDFGHTEGDEHFFAQMDFLTPELLRVLKPGRVAAVHVKDRILFGSVTGKGMPMVNPFHAKTLFHYMAHGFAYMGMITVVTDVVRENNQTYRLGWSENAKDSSKMGVGSPEYVLLFRKLPSSLDKAYADDRVTKDKPDYFIEGDPTSLVPYDKDRRDIRPMPETGYSRSRWQIDAHAMWRSSGDRLMTPEELAVLPPDQLSRAFTAWTMAGVYDYEAHVRIGEALDARGALPATFMSLAPGSWRSDVWHDVNRMHTLNGEQTKKGLENHICLARGSLVLTRRGWMPIQEIEVGEQVLTHKGRWRPVTVVKNTGVRPVITVKAHGVPGLTLTPDHKLWTRRVRRGAWSQQHSRREAIKIAPDWVSAAETKGSYVNLKGAPEEFSWGISDTHWWIIGRWLADGHYDAYGYPIISCGRHEVTDLVGRLGPHAGSVGDTGTAVQIRLKDRDGVFRAILSTCGAGASGKQLPAAAYGLPAREAKALLDGYLSGDGHFVAQRRRWTASSVSKALLLGMAILVQRAYGAVASLYPGRRGGSAVIQGRRVRTLPDWVLCFDDPSAGRSRQPLLLDDGAWKKVRSIEDAGEVETWCLRVAEDESFTAEGCIVKNCPLQFDIVDRLIRRFTNEGELVFDPFGGLFTVPVRAMKLGRRGRAVELSSKYFLDGVKYCQATSGQVATPGLFDVLDIEAIGKLEAAE